MNKSRGSKYTNKIGNYFIKNKNTTIMKYNKILNNSKLFYYSTRNSIVLVYIMALL